MWFSFITCLFFGSEWHLRLTWLGLMRLGVCLSPKIWQTMLWHYSFQLSTTGMVSPVELCGLTALFSIFFWTNKHFSLRRSKVSCHPQLPITDSLLLMNAAISLNICNDWLSSCQFVLLWKRSKIEVVLYVVQKITHSMNSMKLVKCSVTFIVLVTSHQGWKQTRNCVCFHLWSELTLALWCHSIVWSLFSWNKM